MPQKIVIDAEPRASFAIRLVGRDYHASAPKGSLGIQLARRARAAQKDGDVEMSEIWDDVLSWVDMAFGVADGGEIRARLDDPEDLLDVPHIIEVMQKLSEAASGNPTT